ncbi:hypothetical protein CFH99_24505 [Nocardioides aromaticivorans]|uniref:EthD domain-containing protein n=1 Tax=Nocardioides aromaticivorans TaxID=200618 RepID=A0ABX7PS07_9ACTN|nr:EthD family reductase [Nocardioides aromaticivorans]QSR28788.1 hypothetical protein CFH99_24505 [Nocardioides aromaticivorans]
MPKIIALITKQDELSREEFLHHWQVDHPPIVWALPGLRRYVQNPAIPHRTEWPYDGAAELWFESLRDIAVAFDSPQAKPMHEHEKKFIKDIAWFVADEHETTASKEHDA